MNRINEVAGLQFAAASLALALWHLAAIELGRMIFPPPQPLPLLPYVKGTPLHITAARPPQ
ncbi:MAG: hypothetical protein UY39_C0009G0003 [Candidatus Kaiserbacteria bacterium GW2011_GWC2_49_12]|uniref:Uncharacterized protein n=3 Tax=Candidatus Kaiseribacteriota TaxID=1752734 RepID=A0A0G1WGP0_9BACT|nr:MAG: hypothetical protein UY39_C0009G0003 [Candidatus Kaiserbacteria bacterium GW2011_GWC2_49_12]KKW17780.1 MAG: hypothetical protein UY57_C0010G0010 [Candidatus Kaiserbacteria bacterium GW2011_GWB1_50_17]KKW18353.1 MAG: hypothetical protein UY59_C0008G0009 [Candidatus Kaiserbacteria bacterium GW2011_GWA1_50_28]